MTESKNFHTILIGELTTYNLCVMLKVTDTFLKTLKRSPKTIIKRPNNAYIFGKKYKLTDYVKVGSHDNDAGSTGILLYDGLNKYKLDEIKNSPLWDDTYHISKKYKKALSWTDKKALKKIQMVLSDKILFVGETSGGDVGADIYIHKTRGNIDSLIIDVNCLFNS